MSNKTTKSRQTERNLELDIKINTGHAILKHNNKIEITDCGDFTIEELEYLISEAKNFILYKNKTTNI